MTRLCNLLLVCLLAVPACAATQDRAYLLHLNGIGGERSCDHFLLEGLGAGGFPADMSIYDWTHGEDVLLNLQDRQRNQAEAKIINGMIRKQVKAEPKRRFVLTCHSGGAGLAAWALEMLPDDVMIDTWVMFAPALSPQYDLSKALRHVRGKAYVFSSAMDTLVLSTGTRVFGTIDRVKGDAAGLNGFVKPESAEAAQYRKLVELPYKPSWLARYGSAGTHVSALMPRFARDYVAVLLRTGQPPADKPLQAATTRPAVSRSTP